MPADYQQQLYFKYHNCTQGNLSVDEYTKEIYHLYTRNNMEELEFQIVAKYIGRLKQEIQDEIVEMIWDLGTMVTGAKKLEARKQCVIFRT